MTQTAIRAERLHLKYRQSKISKEINHMTNIKIATFRHPYLTDQDVERAEKKIAGIVQHVSRNVIRDVQQSEFLYGEMKLIGYDTTLRQEIGIVWNYFTGEILLSARGKN